MLSIGDIVSLKEKAKSIPAVMEAISLPERDVPDYVEVDHSKFSGSLIRIPMPDEVPYPVQMETNLVIEFYSR
jgi:small subunit ribosomal protein S4